MSDGQLEVTEGMVKPTADVLGMGAGHTLDLEPVADFKVGDDHGPGALGDLDRVANVIAVAVGDQDVVCFDYIGWDGSKGVVGEEWVYQDLCASDVQSENSVSVPRQFDGHFFFLVFMGVNLIRLL